MEHFAAFMTMALTAVAVENVSFTRALGLNRFTLLLKSRKSGIIYGAAMTWLLFLSSFPVSFFNYLMLDVSYARAVRAPLYLLCVLMAYIATYFLSKRFFPKIFETILPALPVSTFNTALFGSLFVSSMQRFDFFQTTGYALGAGVGYTISLLIVYYARKRLAISPIPRSFRGLPILLVYIGLLSLAIYGLIGHGLPV